MKYGEIWWVCFDPSVGHEYRKKRPAVIIASNELIKKLNLITVLPITSNKSNCQGSDFVVRKNGINNLFCDSVIKVSHISTFDKNRFLKKVGMVDDTSMYDVKEYLKIYFDLK